MYFLVKQLKELQIQLKLHHKSKVILEGGWKQYADQEIDREEFYELIDSTLGIKRNQCFEFYSAWNILYRIVSAERVIFIFRPTPELLFAIF